MTREEAIKKMQAVKAYMTYGNPIWGVTEMGEAFDMAIKALEEEPIRCGECKYWDEYIGWCRVRNEYIFNDDFFCKYTERKEGEADAVD